MNMLKERRFFIKLLPILAMFFAFSCFGAINVFAAEARKVQLTGSGSDVEIILTFPEAAKEEIASLQMSLSVSLSSGSGKVEFVPNSALAAKIAEGRYSDGILNIYVAGTSPLFNKENPVLSLGVVRVSGSGCYADVKIVKDSLKFVRGTELLVQDTGVEYSEESVRITAKSDSTGNSGGGGFVVPPVTEEPAQTSGVETSASASAPAAEVTTSAAVSAETTSVTQSSPSAGNTEGQTRPDDNVPPLHVEGESFSRADASKLSDAVSRAEQYKRSNYTDSSYQILNEALGRAKSLLSDGSASQDVIDEALLILENAIGMLVPSNSPSEPDVKTDDGAAETTLPEISEESSSEEETEPITAETVPDTSIITSEAQNNTTSVPTQESGASDENTADDPDKTENLTVWIIVLVVLGAAVAVTAVAAVISANKKKSAKGNHSRSKSQKKDD